MPDLLGALDDYLRRWEAARSRLPDIENELAAVHLTGASEDGSVTATVGGRGVLREIAIDPDTHAYRRPATTATAILQAVDRAATAAAAERGRRLAPLELTPPDVLRPDPATLATRVQQLRDVRRTASAGHGAVTATVDGLGDLVALGLDSTAYRHYDAAVLGDRVVEAVTGALGRTHP